MDLRNISPSSKDISQFGMSQQAIAHQDFVGALIPTVVQKTNSGERAFDLYSRLMSDRIVMFTGEVEDNMASIAVAQILYLYSVDKKKPIFLYINSPGGSVSAGMSVFDTMRFVDCPIITVCTGMAASMGAFLLSAGDFRFALPNSKVMIHQPLGGARGQASDMLITCNEIQKTKQKLNQYLAEFSGQPLEKVVQDTDRDYWMTAEEAVEYGLVDKVYETAKKGFNKEVFYENHKKEKAKK